jgi:formylglycine-generating enzyme required for sulfatase activity
MRDAVARTDRELIETRPGHALGEITKPGWYVNGEGQAFAVMPAPGPFEIGSPPEERLRFGGEGEDRRWVRIDYPFAVALKPVTVAEFKRSRPCFDHGKQWSPGEDTPINNVSWYDAARYCNWLSAREGIKEDQVCYEPNDKGEYAEGMKLKINYQALSGYRLPREEEWEYACRAGTVTTWSYGSDQSMLPQYAWFTLNSDAKMHAVGTLKPNGLGLFDMQGNAWQWCQDVFDEEADRDNPEVKNNIGRVLRGGSFDGGAGATRAAYRIRVEPASRIRYSIGFRTARTIR